MGRNFYVTQRGLQLLADRDRVDASRLVEVTHLDPEGEAAIRERRHDSAVAETAAAFRGAGIPVVAGWRWMVSWRDGQLVPDLWVQVPVPGREEGIWVAAEVEFSAKTAKRIEEKYRSYRLAPVRLNRMFPILVITGEALPAKRFDDQARDLPVLTTTLKEFLTGVWEGPESVWRRKGRPVGLSDFAREDRAHLWQRTGQSLDYSEPTLEVWVGFLGEESIWSDPQTQDLDWEPRPMDRQLQAKMDRVLNEVKAEPPANKPVSAPTPPTPPPAPVGKAPAAQDRVLHEAPAPPAPSPEPVRTLANAQDRSRQREEVLGQINRRVAEADRIAARRVKETDLTDVERHDGCEQECGGWEEGFADALAGMQEWSITGHDGICRCEFCVTGIALIEAALGDMAGILREIRGELKPAEPSGGVHQQRRWSWPSGREGTPGRRAESPEQLPRHWKPSVRYSWGIPHGFTPFA